MYAVLMTALVATDAQAQACLFRNRHSAVRSGCFCSGYVSCGCCTPVIPSCCHYGCGGYVTTSWSSCGCFSGCNSYVGCCSIAVPVPVAYGCSFPVVVDGVAPFHAAPVGVAVPQPTQAAGGSGGLSSDPSVTPLTEAEREAVRKAIKSVREKKSAPSNDGLSPLPPINNPKLDVTPPPPGLSAQAKLMIRVPENAKLWVDDVACPLEGEMRSFTTPNLEPGLEYSYTVRIEVERDGKMTTAERLVQFAAGKTVEVDFGANAASVVRR